MQYVSCFHIKLGLQDKNKYPKVHDHEAMGKKREHDLSGRAKKAMEISECTSLDRSFSDPTDLQLHMSR